MLWLPKLGREKKVRACKQRSAAGCIFRQQAAQMEGIA